jgi:hypothetical protein
MDAAVGYHLVDAANAEAVLSLGSNRFKATLHNSQLDVLVACTR